jgi:hypothetical protein
MRYKQLKSISVLYPLEKMEDTLSEIGFSLEGAVTIMSGGKFWKKKTYFNG